MADKETKAKDEYKETLDYLDIESKELEDKAFVSFKKQTEVTDKVTSLKNLVIDYQMILEGKTYDAEAGGYTQTGKALAGSEFTKISSGILMNYSQEANFLTSKDKDTFIMQFKDAHEKVNLSLSMRNRAVPERTHRAILKMWKDAFWNLSEIIINSDGNMERIFGRIEDLKKKADEEANW